MIEFDEWTNTKELDKNLKIQGFPSELQDKVKYMVTEYWDMFCEDRFRRPIQGFSFQIDTVNHPPIFCKLPSYSPHESGVMQSMVEIMD